MANLKSDNVTIGNFVRALVKDEVRLRKMTDDAFATEEFGKLLDLPAGHRIKVHLDEENVTHVIIPLASELAEAEQELEDTERGYPTSYVPDPLAVFKASANPDKAFSFRLGEYVMRRCKG
jgi:hypothetical protein